MHRSFRPGSGRNELTTGWCFVLRLQLITLRT